MAQKTNRWLKTTVASCLFWCLFACDSSQTLETDQANSATLVGCERDWKSTLAGVLRADESLENVLKKASEKQLAFGQPGAFIQFSYDIEGDIENTGVLDYYGLIGSEQHNEQSWLAQPMNAKIADVEAIFGEWWRLQRLSRARPSLAGQLDADLSGKFWELRTEGRKGYFDTAAELFDELAWIETHIGFKHLHIHVSYPEPDLDFDPELTAALSRMFRHTNLQVSLKAYARNHERVFGAFTGIPTSSWQDAQSAFFGWDKDIHNLSVGLRQGKSLYKGDEKRMGYELRNLYELTDAMQWVMRIAQFLVSPLENGQSLGRKARAYALEELDSAPYPGPGVARKFPRNLDSDALKTKLKSWESYKTHPGEDIGGLKAATFLEALEIPFLDWETHPLVSAELLPTLRNARRGYAETLLSLPPRRGGLDAQRQGALALAKALQAFLKETELFEYF